MAGEGDQGSKRRETLLSHSVKLDKDPDPEHNWSKEIVGLDHHRTIAAWNKSRLSEEDSVVPLL